MEELTKNEKLKVFLEQVYGKPLTEAEIKEHKDRLAKFFGLLVEIDMKNKKKK